MLWWAVAIVAEVLERYGADLWITSARDGEHKEGSFHYSGEAFDVRSKHLPRYVKLEVLEELRAALGNEFDVLFEYQGMPNEHFHIEHDPPAIVRAPQEGTMPEKFFLASRHVWIVLVNLLAGYVALTTGTEMSPGETTGLIDQGGNWIQMGAALVSVVLAIWARTQPSSPTEELTMLPKAFRR